LGLCRRVVFADVLRRYLEYRGYEVKHAMNLGDIDDRTVKECLKSGADLAEFTARWEKVFFDDLDALRVMRAHHYPRASEHVTDMVEQTRNLLEKGLAYEKLRSIYFKLSSFPDYGKLSGIEPKQVRSEASTTYDWYEKDNPQDFALFKRPTLAELKAGIFWRTPWGTARPGWHIECSCMAVQYLGQPLDIHTASTDLTFPHGDNEIAIACGLEGKPLANVWMHSEVVMAGGKKVSRAAGNNVTLGDLTAQGFDGRTVRYWLLATHYRTVLKYSREELERARQCVSRLNEFVARLRHFGRGPASGELDQALYEARTGCQDAMDNDLNAPMALGKLFAFIRHANRLMNRGEMDAEQVEKALDFMRLVNRILDVIDFEDDAGDAEVRRLIDERDTARHEKDFQRADALRDQLQSLGVQLADGRSGTRWKRG
jgi:cysteinyl-tRNA synthetase